MWILAKNIGFLSIVQDDKNADLLCVRAQDRQHLVNAFPDHVDDIIGPYGDYLWRVSIERPEVMDLMVEALDDVDYTTNAKGTISGDDHELHGALTRAFIVLEDFGVARLAETHPDVDLNQVKHYDVSALKLATSESVYDWSEEVEVDS